MCGGGSVSLEVRGQGRSVPQCVGAIAVRVAARDVEVLACHAVSAQSACAGALEGFGSTTSAAHTI